MNSNPSTGTTSLQSSSPQAVSSIPTGIRTSASDTVQVATFAAGCFWGVEETFRTTPGVTSTRVGYIGGNTVNPTYKEVCNKETGHAEAVEVTFDPSKVTYTALVDIFFSNHNPTQLNRQGPDFGTQYRSGIFYHNDEQKAQSEMAIKSLSESGRFKQPIVTQVVEAPQFYVAEDYHQQYLNKRGLDNCHF